MCPGGSLRSCWAHSFYIKIRITSPCSDNGNVMRTFFSYEGLLIAGCRTRDFSNSAVLLRDLEGPVDRGGQIVAAEDNDCHGVTSRFCRRSCGAGVCSPFACKSGGMKCFLFHICILMFLFNFFIFPYFSFSSQDLPPEGSRLRRAESLPATTAVLSGEAFFRSPRLSP